MKRTPREERQNPCWAAKDAQVILCKVSAVQYFNKWARKCMTIPSWGAVKYSNGVKDGT